MIVRREFLRRISALGASAAVPAAMLGACGGDEDAPVPSRETHRYQFDLSAAPIAEPRLFAARSASHRRLLKAHDSASRAWHRAMDTSLEAVPDAQLTHYLDDVDLPAGALQGLQVTGRHPQDGRPLLAAAKIHVPSSTRRVREARRREPGTAAHRLAESAATQAGHTLDDRATPWDTAVYLVFHHPEVMNLNPDLGAEILDRIANLPCDPDDPTCTPLLGNLAFKIASLVSTAGYPSTTPGSWATLVPFVDLDGNPVLDENGQPVYRHELDDGIAEAIGDVVKQVLLNLFDDPAFEGSNWNATSGLATVAPDGTAAAFASGAARRDAATDAFNVTADYPPGSSISGIRIVDLAVTDAEARQLTLTIRNDYLRYLSVFASYADANGSPVSAPGTSLDTSRSQYLAVVAPNNQIMGIPLQGSDVAKTSIKILVPQAASSATVIFGSLGLGGDPFCPEATLGSCLTLAISIGLPTLLLALGIYLEAKDGILGLLADTSLLETIGSEIMQALLNAGVALGDGVYGSVSSQSVMPFLAVAGNIVVQVLLKASPRLALYITTLVTAQAPINTILPAVAVAIRILSTLAAAAAIATSVCEVLASAAITKNRLSLTMASTVRLSRDPADFQFPASARKWVAKAYYDGGAIPRTHSGAMVQGQVDPIDIVFAGVPSGGKVRFVVSLYSDDGCIVGLAQSDSLANLPQTAGLVPLSITERRAALTASTQYQHSLKLAYTASGHVWQSGPAPQQTLVNLCSGGDSAVCELTGVTVNTASGMAGYGFRSSVQSLCSGGSGSGYTARNLFLGHDPDSAAKSLGCAYSQPVGLLYDPVGPAAGGRHFYVEPGDGGFHLRAVPLDASTPWSTGSHLSWGAFTEALDSLAVLPSGYVVGVNRQTHKMEVLLLTETPVDQSDESQAIPFATPKCGEGTRADLLNTPVAVASWNGAVLVLEQGNARVQALDVHANAVNLFASGTSSLMSLQPESGVTYLDLAVEGQGYMYVLSYQGDGTLATQYRLDLYTPDGAFLSRTAGVPAARMAVDLFRNLYTLNYETLTGTPSPEPSLSQWLPITPGACPVAPPASGADFGAASRACADTAGIRT